MGERERKRLESTAYHEAGHAVMAIELGLPFRYVTIDPEGDSLGHIRYNVEKPGRRWTRMSDRDRLDARVITSFAGGLSERKFRGRHNRVGADSDCDGIVDLALDFCSSGEEATAYVRWLEIRTSRLLDRPATWLAVGKLAEALLDRRRLSSRAACEIVKSAVPEEMSRRMKNARWMVMPSGVSAILNGSRGS